MNPELHSEEGLSSLNSNLERSSPLLLFKRVKLIVFDWDGTAVMSREAIDLELIAVLEQLLRRQVLCVIITGTSVQNLIRPVLQYLSPYAKSQVYVCANRGSEVYGFNAQGQEVLLECYSSTPEQEVRLDEVAQDLQAQWVALGLKTHVIRDRLNRRKIDLIPEDEKWRDPRKDQVFELYRAVLSQFSSTQLTDGISGLIKSAHQCAKKWGLSPAQITTDLKHIEIGLTSKEDSMRWVIHQLMSQRGISPEEVLGVGDEFSSPEGVLGSDSFLIQPALSLALFVSVGREPWGVPPGVIHEGGGPSRFKSLLGEVKQGVQVREELMLGNELHEGNELLTWGWSERDPLWRVEQNAFDPSAEAESETLFTLGNGYLGIRGSLSIPIPSSRGDLFLAGVFDESVKRSPLLQSVPILKEDLDEFSERVTFPSVFYLRLKIQGEFFVPGRWEYPHPFRRYLSLDTGVLSEVYDIQINPEGARLKIHTQRLVVAHLPHLLIQEVQLSLTQGEVELEVDTSLEDPDHEWKHPHLQILSMETENPEFTELHEFQTRKSQVRSVFVARSYHQGMALPRPALGLKLSADQPQVIQKFILVYHSEDSASPRNEALTAMRGLSPEGLPLVWVDHLKFWRKFWESADVLFPHQKKWERSLRFNAYHLRIAARENSRTSIGARTLSGSAYEGHIFWDTEIFILPFFNHHAPRITRSCLEYRQRSLPQAKLRAQQMGCLGACFAWESTLTGKDVTPTHISLAAQQVKIPVFTGTQQIHITADVAYAVSQYWLCTQDMEGMIRFGAELLIETARFWVSRVQKMKQRYHLSPVVGPDEYHHDVCDNAYTNWMARENLRGALRICETLQSQVSGQWSQLESRLQVSAQERKIWAEVEHQLYLPEPNDQGVIEEFEGFFKLSPLPLESEESFTVPLDRLLLWEKVNQSQIVKQADVLMIPFLFQEVWTPDVLRANYKFYKPITDHGSSLSLAVYAGIAAQLGEWEDCQNYWEHSLDLDLANLMKNTALGIHAGCLGGTWQALIFHILGIRRSEEGLAISQARRSPLPDPWRGLRTQLQYQNQTYAIEVSLEGQVSLCQITKSNPSYSFSQARNPDLNKLMSSASP